MLTRFLLMVGLLLSHGLLQCAQIVGDKEIARLMLEKTKNRAKATMMVADARKNNLMILLSWMKKLPQDVDQRELKVAMADAFRELKLKESVPFLIRNIQLSRYDASDPWMKTGEIIEARLPAVAALISIGAAATDSLMSLYQHPLDQSDRLPTIFALARIRDPKTKGFLSTSAGEAYLIHLWAMEGCKAMEHQAQNTKN